jgi:glutathione S-transferase
VLFWGVARLWASFGTRPRGFSPLGLQVEIAAAAAGIALKVEEIGRDHEVFSEVGPAFEGVPVLATKDGLLPRTVPILAFLSSLAPDAGLAGSSAFEEAQVDQWMQVWVSDLAAFVHILHAVGVDGSVAKGSALEQTLRASKGKVSPDRVLAMRASAEQSVAQILGPLSEQLVRSTFLVGERLTMADIAIASQLLPALASGSIAVRPASLIRWALTCAHSEAFTKVLGPPPSLTTAEAAAPAPAATPVTAAASASASALHASSVASSLVNKGSASAGALSPPPVFTAKWSRGRLRMSEVLAGVPEIVGATVTVGGWVRSTRSQAHITFVDLTDGSTMEKFQAVFKSELVPAEVLETVAALPTGSSVRVTGTVVPTLDKKSVELDAQELTVLGTLVASEYPIAKARLSAEYLRSVQHLRPRTNLMAAVTRVRNACAFATHRFFQERGFLYIHTPLITASDCEGAGEMFAVTTLMPSDPKKDVVRDATGAIDYSKDFFGKQTSLTVSGQLQVESFACSMSDVYTFGPTFRAEESHTTRHLSEFWMIEPEIA